MKRWPEMVDNLIPYIGGEEEKSEQEPLKVWGQVEDGEIVNAARPRHHRPVPAGALSPTAIWPPCSCTFRQQALHGGDQGRPGQNFKGRAQELELPSAPKQFLHYFEEPNRPQTRLDRDLEGGMAISLGRLRPDTQYDYKFVGLSHNTLRGAAGGAVLLAELLCAEGYI